MPDALAACLTDAWSSRGLVRLVAIDASTSADALRRFGAATGRAVRANVARFSGDRCVCLEDCGATERERDDAPILIGAPGRFRPQAVAVAGEALPLDMPDVRRDAAAPTDLGVEHPDAATFPLTEADVVLAAGAGVSDWDLFHRLATALNAAEAGSRVVCDAGHLPRDRQVGVSGNLIAARCYIAFGISGAIQHMQGIEGCRRVVAINRDEHAPLLKRADLVAVADTGAVMRALIERLEAGA